MQVIKCRQELHKPRTKPLHPQKKNEHNKGAKFSKSRMYGYRAHYMPQNSDYLTTSSEKWLLLVFLMVSDLHKPQNIKIIIHIPRTVER